MVMACGKKVQELVINIKVSIMRIRNMAMVFFHGHLVISIKEIIKRI